MNTPEHHTRDALQDAPPRRLCALSRASGRFGCQVRFFLSLSFARRVRALSLFSLPTPLPPSLPPSLPFSRPPFLPFSRPPFLTPSLLACFPLSPGLSLSLPPSRVLSLSLSLSLSRARARSLSCARSLYLPLYLPLGISLSPKQAQTHMHTFAQGQLTHTRHTLPANTHSTLQGLHDKIVYL